MNDTPGPLPDPSSIDRRTAEILAERSESGHRTVNRMFSLLLLIEWLAAITVALVISPTAWAGEAHGIHPHVWSAFVLGSLAVSLPFALAMVRPGRSSTRQCVAIGQMLLVALLIHLSGGRIETHFHVFVSLAFLALYRDWRVMITASAVSRWIITSEGSTGRGQSSGSSITSPCVGPSIRFGSLSRTWS